MIINGGGAEYIFQVCTVHVFASATVSSNGALPSGVCAVHVVSRLRIPAPLPPQHSSLPVSVHLAPVSLRYSTTLCTDPPRTCKHLARLCIKRVCANRLIRAHPCVLPPPPPIPAVLYKRNIYHDVHLASTFHKPPRNLAVPCDLVRSNLFVPPGSARGPLHLPAPWTLCTSRARVGGRARAG